MNRMAVSSRPEVRRVATNLLSSGRTTSMDQSWLWKTKGLLVTKAKTTATTQAMQLLTEAGRCSQFRQGR